MKVTSRMSNTSFHRIPPNVRRTELTNLKKTRPELHAMVKQELANAEQGVKSEAVAQSKAPQPAV